MIKTRIAAAVLMLPAAVPAQDTTRSKKESPFRQGTLETGATLGGASLQVNPFTYRKLDSKFTIAGGDELIDLRLGIRAFLIRR